MLCWITSGLDIPSVLLVLNYDIPRDPTDYIHRVGRTARAGRGGQAISIVCERDIQLVQDIESRISKWSWSVHFNIAMTSQSICLLMGGSTALYVIVDKTMGEYPIPENKALEILNEVSSAKRAANMVSLIRCCDVHRA
jgi:ATP-dependent RNA helicase DDX49/DBP8